MTDGWLVAIVAGSVAVTLWVLHRLGDKEDPPDE